MILLLVAVSIGWIPLIQQMQGGQMYVYIQSIAAYISPPIAMTFCMAMTWARMNEAVRKFHILLLLINLRYKNKLVLAAVGQPRYYLPI